MSTEIYNKRNGKDFIDLQSMYSELQPTMETNNDYEDHHYEFYNDYKNSKNFKNTNDEIQSNSSNHSSNKSLAKNLKCEMCQKSNDTTYTMLSCCNIIVHVKCVLDTFLINDDVVLNENIVDKMYIDKIKCYKCNNNMPYSDIFSIHCKNINNTKNICEKFNIQKQELENHKKKIENEIKCINEYVQKIESDKKISQIIMAKTFSLLTNI
jgi:hypothetical protein